MLRKSSHLMEQWNHAKNGIPGLPLLWASAYTSVHKFISGGVLFVSGLLSQSNLTKPSAVISYILIFQ